MIGDGNRFRPWHSRIRTPGELFKCLIQQWKAESTGKRFHESVGDGDLSCVLSGDGDSFYGFFVNNNKTVLKVRKFFIEFSIENAISDGINFTNGLVLIKKQSNYL